MRNMKSTAQVKRKLDFRELPLKGKTFYLDIRSDVTKNKVARRLKELGGKVETFLTRDLHLLITDRNGEANAQKGQRGKTESSTQGDPSSLIQTKLSFPLSRGKALLLKATQTSEGSACSSTITAKDAVQNAQNLGVKVEHFTKFLKDCHKLLQKLKQMSPVHCDDAKKELDRDFTPINWKHESRIVLKVEDSNTFFKPIFKEFEKPPKIHYNGDCGSPFAEGIVLKRQEVRENRYSTRKKTQNVAPKGGFCEACDYWYNCHLREHLLSVRHQDYLGNQKNFASLKNIVNEMPSFDTFISKYKCAPSETASSKSDQAEQSNHFTEHNVNTNSIDCRSKSQPVGFSTDSLSAQQVEIADIINKLDNVEEVKPHIQAKPNVSRILKCPSHSSNDISWDSGVNRSSNSASNIHLNDVHMQTVVRQSEPIAAETTDVRKKLMSCSLNQQSGGSDPQSDKTEEYAVDTYSKVLIESNVRVSSICRSPCNKETGVLNSSKTEEYECTRNLFTSSESEKTEQYNLLKKDTDVLGEQGAPTSLSVTSSQLEDKTEEYDLSQNYQNHAANNPFGGLAKRLSLDETSESGTDISMADDYSLRTFDNSDIENMNSEKYTRKQFRSMSNNVRTTTNGLPRPFSNLTNVLPNATRKRPGSKKIVKQRDSADEIHQPMKLKHGLAEKEEKPCQRKRKLSTDNDNNAPVYYSCKANGTKLKICKVATPVHKKADLRQYWKVRKAGGCRLVFSAEKRKVDTTKAPSLQTPCSPLVKRRKCLF